MQPLDFLWFPDAFATITLLRRTAIECQRTVQAQFASTLDLNALGAQSSQAEVGCLSASLQNIRPSSWSNSSKLLSLVLLDSFSHSQSRIGKPFILLINLIQVDCKSFPKPVNITQVAGATLALPEMLKLRRLLKSSHSITSLVATGTVEIRETLGALE